MCGRYSLTKFANFRIVILHAKIVTIFELKVVTISARNTMREFANFVRLSFERFFPGISFFILFVFYYYLYICEMNAGFFRSEKTILSSKQKWNLHKTYKRII